MVVDGLPSDTYGRTDGRIIALLVVVLQQRMDRGVLVHQRRKRRGFLF